MSNNSLKRVHQRGEKPIGRKIAEKAAVGTLVLGLGSAALNCTVQAVENMQGAARRDTLSHFGYKMTGAIVLEPGVRMRSSPEVTSQSVEPNVVYTVEEGKKVVVINPLKTISSSDEMPNWIGILDPTISPDQLKTPEQRANHMVYVNYEQVYRQGLTEGPIPPVGHDIPLSVKVDPFNLDNATATTIIEDANSNG